MFKFLPWFLFALVFSGCGQEFSHPTEAGSELKEFKISGYRIKVAQDPRMCLDMGSDSANLQLCGTNSAANVIHINDVKGGAWGGSSGSQVKIILGTKSTFALFTKNPQLKGTNVSWVPYREPIKPIEPFLENLEGRSWLIKQNASGAQSIQYSPGNGHSIGSPARHCLNRDRFGKVLLTLCDESSFMWSVVRF